MKKSTIDILTYKKDKCKLCLEIYGYFWILNCFFIALSVSYTSFGYIGLILNFISAIVMYYYTNDTLKFTPKFNKNIFTYTYQTICIITIICFFLDHYLNNNTTIIIICNFILNIIILERFLRKFNKSNFTDLFTEEQIKEVENNE